MKDKKILNINEDELLTEINERAKELVKRSGIVLPNRFPTIKVR
jgi:5-methylthioadenosine/S-adenosylhomocysteine deaminase